MGTYLMKLAVLMFATCVIASAYEAKRNIPRCPQNLFNTRDYYKLLPFNTSLECESHADCPKSHEQCCIRGTVTNSWCHDIVKSEVNVPTCTGENWKQEDKDKFIKTGKRCIKFDVECAKGQCCIGYKNSWGFCHNFANVYENGTIIYPPHFSFCPEGGSCNKNSITCVDDNDCHHKKSIRKLDDYRNFACCHSSTGCCVKAVGYGSWNGCKHCDKVKQPTTCTKACEYYEDHHPPENNPCGEDEVCCPRKEGCCVRKSHSNMRLSDDTKKIVIVVKTKSDKRYEDATFSATINVKDGYIISSTCTDSPVARCYHTYLD